MSNHDETRTIGTLETGETVTVRRRVWDTGQTTPWSIEIDGAYSGRLPDAGDDEALELAAQTVAERAAYAARAAELEPISAYLTRGEEPDLPKAGVDEVTVGDVVWIYSRGNVRRGEVAKVGRSRIHVEYVSSTGTITKKDDTHVWLERRVDLGEA